VKLPRYCQIWATLVRATRTPGQPEPVIEPHTISWLPATGEIHPERLHVEPGRNSGLHETIELALRERTRVSVWGPYEVWHGLAYRFMTQKEILESGRVSYQAADNIGEAARTRDGCDCIHAVTDMDPVYDRARYPIIYYRDVASANLVRRFMHSPGFIDPPTTHDWLIPRLGLDTYPIVRREYRGRAVPYHPGSAGEREAPAARLVPNLAVETKP
jgi:hypothetical protein